MARPALPPAASPCRYCPMRRDVPSGVWHLEEYAKLPPYDRPTGEQPSGLFLCHVQNGRVCAGWVGVLDVLHALAVRFAAFTGALAPDDADALADYATDVPLFPTFAAAAAHGARDLNRPGPAAREAMTRLGRLHEQPLPEEPAVPEFITVHDAFIQWADAATARLVPHVRDVLPRMARAVGDRELTLRSPVQAWAEFLCLDDRDDMDHDAVAGAQAFLDAVLLGWFEPVDETTSGDWAEVHHGDLPDGYDEDDLSAWVLSQPGASRVCGILAVAAERASADARP